MLMILLPQSNLESKSKSMSKSKRQRISPNSMAVPRRLPCPTDLITPLAPSLPAGPPGACKKANCLALAPDPGDNRPMTAAIVVNEIERMPPEEHSPVIQPAIELARKRQLSGSGLATLAQRMAESHDPAEVEKLKSALTRGFYGG
jgi:hypothetical protein